MKWDYVYKWHANLSLCRFFLCSDAQKLCDDNLRYAYNFDKKKEKKKKKYMLKWNIILKDSKYCFDTEADENRNARKMITRDNVIEK